MRTERAKEAGEGERWQRYRWGRGGGEREKGGGQVADLATV